MLTCRRVGKLPKIDYVLLSHYPATIARGALREIAQRFPMRNFSPDSGGRYFNDWKTASNEVRTGAGFSNFKPPGRKNLFRSRAALVQRGLFDTNERLWAFFIQGVTQTIYLGGDSGFGSHYKHTAEVFPEIDYFLIGIGGYKPRWFMEPNHNSPEEALHAFTDAKAKFLVPMHYGTFDLSDEPPNEPLRLLKDAAGQNNLSEKIKPLSIGESLEF